MNHRKRTAACFSVMVLAAFFIEGCAVVRWHNRMMQSAMECMGMGSHEGHGDQPGPQAGDGTSPGLCQASTYLDYKEGLGLTPDQIEKLKDLNLSCQRAEWEGRGDKDRQAGLSGPPGRSGQE